MNLIKLMMLSLLITVTRLAAPLYKLPRRIRRHRRYVRICRDIEQRDQSRYLRVKASGKAVV